MEKRDLSLSQRKENTREQKPSIKPLHFTLEEIQNRFDLGIRDLISRVDDAEEMLNSGSVEAAKSILRAQVVFSEGLMDFYIHELSKYCLHQMFEGNWKKSIKYNSLKIPMYRVEAALLSSKSEDWFFEHINDEYSRTVFLGSEPMKEQLNLIGVPFSDVVARAFPKLRPNEAKDKINGLFARRNRIVHQNDRDHATAQQEDIDPSFVREYISDVTNLVSSMRDVAKINESSE